MKTIGTFLMAFAFLIVFISLASADVVELKTGQRVEGTFKQATPAGIVIEVGGQTITFKQEKVQAIYFGSAPASQQQRVSWTSVPGCDRSSPGFILGNIAEWLAAGCTR